MSAMSEISPLSVANRGRPVKTNSDTNLLQYTKQKKPHQKTTKQFSAKSRSKSNTSFKNLQKLHRVSSHDNLSKSALDPMKKSKSSDSLSRKKALSWLSMTALVRTTSHPVVSHNMPGQIKYKDTKGLNSKSIIDLDDQDDNDSATDEEIESFTDLDAEGSEEEETGHELLLKNHIDQNPTIASLHDFPNKSISRVDSTRSMQKQLSYKPPSRLRNRIDQDDDQISSKITSADKQDKLDNDQHDDLIDSSNQEISSTANSLRRHGQRSMDYSNPNNGFEGTLERSIHRNNYDDKINGDKTQNSSRHNIQNNDDGNVIEDHISPLNSNTDSTALKEGTDIKASIKNSNEQYIPDMILSQSTGMERRFDPLSRQSSLAWLNQGEGQDSALKIQNSKSNKFNYINQDLAASLKEEPLAQLSQQQDKKEQDQQQQKQRQSKYQIPLTKTAKTDFSTSISSLTSHLTRPVSRDNLVRSNVSSQPRNAQHSLYRHPSDIDNEQQSGLTDFSSFLQSGDVGADSRTQQKLWLQRENSIQDLSSQNSLSDSVFLASNVEVRREFERISREYTNVRRFSNPLTDALNRVSLQQNIEIKKHKKGISNETPGSFFKLDHNKTKFSKDGYPSGEKLEIQRILAKIWNNNTIEFNKDENPLTQINNDPLSSPNQASYRNPRPNKISNSQHQRTINSLHPTTRAVNRRMEHVMNQQHL